MSRLIRKAIWRQGPFEAERRFVMLAIADFVDYRGRGFAPTRLICERVCGDDRIVLGVIASLEKDGWMKRERDGEDRITYVLNMEKLGITQEMLVAAYLPTVHRHNPLQEGPLN